MPRRQQQQERRPPGGDRFRHAREHEDRDQAVDDTDYGPYVDTDEGDSSVRAGSYDQGREQYGRRDAREQHERDTREQSGSTGRYAGYGGARGGDADAERGGYAGQERYGQSGYGQGGYGQTDGEYRGGNYGRGRAGSRGDYGGYGEGDSRTGGPHRGKGPKGYQRSDERLKEMISERLREDPHIDASEVSVDVQAGRVTFDGTVDSRRTKNLIEDVAEQLGCDDVQNNLRVQRQR